MSDETPDLLTYVEGLETELHFSTDPTHQAAIKAEIDRVNVLAGGTPAVEVALVADESDPVPTV
jgi:hypothetical protein